MPKRLLLGILILLFIVIAYVILSVGVIESVLLIPNRSSKVHQLEMAVQFNPPDVDYVLEEISSPDWFVASTALHYLEDLRKSDALSIEQSNKALNVVFENLGERGHWWRFGWDKEEAQFNQFYSQVINTASAFGSDLLPWLQIASQDSNPLRREAVCKIIEQLPKDTVMEENDKFLESTREIVQNLASSDPSALVMSTCSRVLGNPS